MSLSESIELQRQAVARDREAAEKRARQQELDKARPKAMGSILKDAMQGVPEMSGFMCVSASGFSYLESDGADVASHRRFHADSDDEGGDDDFGLAEQQEEEEDREALNPYREAYRAGYERAAREDEGPPPEDS